MCFRGDYDFLSNFYKCYVEYEGVIYSSVENVKVKIMCNLVFKKFNNSEYLRTRLPIVQDKIIEENFWHDNFLGNM